MLMEELLLTVLEVRPLKRKPQCMHWGLSLGIGGLARVCPGYFIS
jgi:hypothetical protein